jgi:4-amino-4-deoxy-L-arabinose transferase-like glycosyltransferase
VKRVAGRLTARNGFLAVCAFVVIAGVWNVAGGDPGLGYDYLEHKAYADMLVPGGHLPHGVGEYYTPPGFYAVAGFLDWIAHGLGVGEPHRAGEAANVLFLFGTVVLVWKLARELFPGRDRLALGAVLFAALLPVSERAGSMFHPEAMSLFFSTLALWACVRTFRNPRYAWLLGIALGLAQLVRAFALWTVFVALVALVVGRRWRELALVVVLAAAIPAPWYVHQAVEYNGNPLFPRPATPLAQTPTGAAKPLWERRPWRFYVDPGLPDVIGAPYSPHFANLALPTTYTELWGDYFGVWAWHGLTAPDRGVRRELQVQALVGILPTLLAVAGWFALLAETIRRRSPPLVAIALLPAVGLLGYLYFTVSYPTYVGDVLKATYMLTTAPVWALAFGFALERLRGRAWPAVFALLVLCALADLPFIVYG